MKPILFNTEMVRAILDGRKTVTRRVVKISGWKIIGNGKRTGFGAFWFDVANDHIRTTISAYPPYRTGDTLYVRETFHQTPNGQYWYKADNLCKGCTEDGFCKPRGVKFHETCKICEYYDGYQNIKWRPSIHMPREAARIFLRVMDVKVKRVQDITDEESRKEGCAGREDFHRVWNECYAKPRPVKGENGVIDHYESYPWENIQETRTYLEKPWRVIGNPWTWGIEFERIREGEQM